MSRRSKLVIVTALAMCGAAYAEQAPEFPDDGMPLALYKKLDALAQVMLGVEPRPLGFEGMNAEAAKKALAADVASNVEAMKKGLGSKQVIQRRLAAWALGYCADKAKGVELLKGAMVDTDAEVRRAAAGGLKELPDGSAVDALIAGLDDTDERVRCASAQALGAIKDSRAARPLLKLLGDKAWGNRLHAALALGEIKDKSVLPDIQKALESESDPRVRMGLAAAARKIAGKEEPDSQGAMEPGQGKNVLHELSDEMKKVEGKLRDDLHDIENVQVPQKKIEDQLVELIKKVEEMMAQGQGQGKKSGEQQQQSQGQSGQQSGGNPTSPLKTSVLPSGPPRGALQPGEVVSKEAAWAHLPPAMREELNQVYKEDMPERWRRRLEEYFLSVAAEENKANK